MDFGKLKRALTPSIAVDLIRQLLQKQPNQRISASEALEHNYFKSESLPSCDKRMRF